MKVSRTEADRTRGAVSRNEMGLYSHAILPLFYDWLMDKPHLNSQRSSLLAELHGEVLEVGVGTGLNMPHYPSSVEHIHTVDPSHGMNTKLAHRIRGLGIPVSQHILSGESLPFESDRFDFVVSTLTLCSIPRVENAVAEIYRVLKPGAAHIFLEHGLSKDALIGKWQRRLNPLQRVIAAGCQLTLDVPAVLAKQPFAEVQCSEFYLEKTPKVHGYMYRGFARK